MKTILALLATAASVVLNVLKLRVRETAAQHAAEDARDIAAANLRHDLATGRIGDAGADRADHARYDALLTGDGAKQSTRRPRAPKR